MAETSVPSLLRQTNAQQQEVFDEPEPDQHSLNRPFFQTVDSLTGIFSRNINDDHDDVLLSDFCSACLDTLYSHISCSSDSDCDSESALDSDSNLNSFHENDLMDLVMRDLCVSCQEDEFSLSYGQISNSQEEEEEEEEVEEERLGFGLDRSVVAPGRRESSVDGLRVASTDSESDSELVNDEIDDGSEEEQLGGTLFWDCIGFEEQMSSSGELDWEEIEERVDNEREGMRSVIDRIEEISVSSSLSRYEIPEDAEVTAAAESLEWEVLVEMVNWDRPRMHQFEAEDDDDDDDNDSYLAVQDDYISDIGENITDFLHQLTRENSILRGSPPTAEHVMKNLPCVVLTEEELQKENLICAVCKDGIVVDEKVTMLPCNHHYHCECIIPWLNVRNTCPLCRYELPTDDMDYELRKNQEGGVGIGGDSEDGYNFEWLV